jgi:hypothetical protein
MNYAQSNEQKVVTWLGIKRSSSFKFSLIFKLALILCIEEYKADIGLTLDLHD